MGIPHGREERHCTAHIKTEMDLRVKMKAIEILITRSSRRFTRKKQTTIDICITIKLEERLNGSKKECNFRKMLSSAGIWACVCTMCMYHVRCIVHRMSQGLLNLNP